MQVTCLPSRLKMHSFPLNLYLSDSKTCLRWLVLVALIWGTLVSSVGLATSHGLAGLAVAEHSVASDDAHGHAHDEDVPIADPAGGHPHHAADHSHDKAHAVPEQLAVAPAASTERIAVVQAWVPGLDADRLDRPPRA